MRRNPDRAPADLDRLPRPARDLLHGLYSRSLLELNDTDLGLELLLPGDSAMLYRRAAALGEWCQGFLYGLALGGVRADAVPEGHVGEVMHDLFEISQARTDTVSSEEEEAAFVEIAEYVRMSVLLCHEELQPVRTPDTLQ